MKALCDQKLWCSAGAWASLPPLQCTAPPSCTPSWPCGWVSAHPDLLAVSCVQRLSLCCGLQVHADSIKTLLSIRSMHNVVPAPRTTANGGCQHQQRRGNLWQVPDAKTCIVSLCVQELQKRASGAGISGVEFFAAHPGIAKSGIFERMEASWDKPLSTLLVRAIPCWLSVSHIIWQSPSPASSAA